MAPQKQGDQPGSAACPEITGPSGNWGQLNFRGYQNFFLPGKQFGHGKQLKLSFPSSWFPVPRRNESQ